MTCHDQFQENVKKCKTNNFFAPSKKMHDMVKSKDIPQFTLYILVLAIYDMKEGNQHFLHKGSLHFPGNFGKPLLKLNI